MAPERAPERGGRSGDRRRSGGRRWRRGGCRGTGVAIGCACIGRRGGVALRCLASSLGGGLTGSLLGGTSALLRLDRVLPLRRELDRYALQTGQPGDERRPPVCDVGCDGLCLRSCCCCGVLRRGGLVEQGQPALTRFVRPVPEDRGQGRAGGVLLQRGVHRRGRTVEGQELAHHRRGIGRPCHRVDRGEAAASFVGPRDEAREPVPLAGDPVASAALGGACPVEGLGGLLEPPARGVVGLGGLLRGQRGRLEMGVGGGELSLHAGDVRCGVRCTVLCGPDVGGRGIAPPLGVEVVGDGAGGPHGEGQTGRRRDDTGPASGTRGP